MSNLKLITFGVIQVLSSLRGVEGSQLMPWLWSGEGRGDIQMFKISYFYIQLKFKYFIYILCFLRFLSVLPKNICIKNVDKNNLNAKKP